LSARFSLGQKPTLRLCGVGIYRVCTKALTARLAQLEVDPLVDLWAEHSAVYGWPPRSIAPYCGFQSRPGPTLLGDFVKCLSELVIEFERFSGVGLALDFAYLVAAIAPFGASYVSETPQPG
jgi:hypothetical protein